MDDKVMVGLDVGSSKVTAVVGMLDANQKLEIIGYATADTRQGVDKGLVKNITKTTEAIQLALNEAGKNANLNIGEVITNVSYQHIDCQEVKGKIVINGNNQEIQHADVERLINDMKKSKAVAGLTNLHICPQDFRVDDDLWGEIYSPVGMPGVNLSGTFLSINAPSIVIDFSDKALKELQGHVDVKERLVSSIASSLSTLTDEEKEAGIALFDIGAANTDVVIYHKNMVRHVFTIPFGGNDLTKDIQQGCNVLPDIAEALKTQHGAAIANLVPMEEAVIVPGIAGKNTKEILLKNVALIIEERLKEIATIAWAKIVKAGFAEKLTAGLVLTGGSSQMADIDTLFEAITGKEVRVGKPDFRLASSVNETLNNPTYATAIGLVWKGFRSYDTRKDEILKSKEKGKVKMTVSSGFDFDTPPPKNFFRRNFEKIKGILKDDADKLNDVY